jgi:HEAT repeats
MKRILIPTAIVAITIAAAVFIGLWGYHYHESQTTKKAVDDLLAQVFHSGLNQRNVFNNLGRMGAKAWPAEIQALSQTGEIGSAAGLVLLNDRNAYKALPEFVRLLGDKRSVVRAQAATLIMFHLRPQDTFALPALIKALSDPNDSVRARSAQALGKLGPAAGKAMPALTKVLHDDSVFARIVAAESLSSIDSNQDAVVIPVLKDAIENADDQNRYWAASGLYRIAPKDPEILPVFISSLTNKQMGIRIGAVYALRPYGSRASAAVPILLKMLKSNDAGAKETMRATLAKIDPEALTSVSAVEVAGSAVAAGAVLGPPPAGSQVIVLTNGIKLTLLGATYGRRHLAPHYESLGTGNWIYTRTNTTVVWILEEHNPKQWFDYELLVSDPANSGCVPTESKTSSHVNNGVDIQGFLLSAFPRWDEQVMVRVRPWPFDGPVAQGEFIVSNPAPATLADWTPQRLPATRSDGDLEVTLTNLIAGVPLPHYPEHVEPTNDAAYECVRLAFGFRQNGHVVTNWTPMLIETSDSVGNHVQTLIRDYPLDGLYRIWGRMMTGQNIPPPERHGTDGYFYQPGLWPDEPAWKVRLDFVQTSGFDDDEIVTFTNLPVKLGTQQDFDDEWGLRYKTNAPFVAQTTVNDVRLKLLPPLLYSDQAQSGQKRIAVIICADPNSVAQAMRLTLLKATDGQGHEIWSPFSSPWAGHFSLDFPNVQDTKTLNLKLALHKDRFVQFTVKPTGQ